MTEILCAIGDQCRGTGIDYTKNPPEPIQLPPRRCWDSAVICDVCRHRLARWIDELPKLHAELADALQPGGNTASRSNGYRNAWPVNPAALGLAGDIYGKLCAWAWLIVTKRGVNPPKHEDVPHIAEWITRLHVDWIAHQDFAPDMHIEIRDLHSQAYRAVYPNRERKIFPLPRHRRTCPHCGGDLYAIIAGNQHKDTMIQCSECDREWDPTQWFRLGRTILARVGA